MFLQILCASMVNSDGCDLTFGLASFAFLHLLLTLQLALQGSMFTKFL
jgi:hypothetical protein